MNLRPFYQYIMVWKLEIPFDSTLLFIIKLHSTNAIPLTFITTKWVATNIH